MAGTKTTEDVKGGELKDTEKPYKGGRTESETPATDKAEMPANTDNLFNTRKSNLKRTFDPTKMKVIGTLTKSLFSIAHSKNLMVKVVSETYTQKLPNAGRAKAEETDTTMIDVINLETGEEGALICNALIVKAFETAKPPLIGRMFAIREGGIREGKKYRSIDMVEIAE